MRLETEKAIKTLRSAFLSDSAYADSWANAMVCMHMDAGAGRDVAKEGASRFMDLVFDIKINEK